MFQLINTVVMVIVRLKLFRVHVRLMFVLLIKLIVQVATELWIKFNVFCGIRWRFQWVVWVVEIAQRS